MTPGYDGARRQAGKDWAERQQLAGAHLAVCIAAVHRYDITVVAWACNGLQHSVGVAEK